jgi:hypothetical protein
VRYTPAAIPSRRKRVLEVIRRRVEGVIGVDFINSLSSFAPRTTVDKCGVDEFWDWRWRLSAVVPAGTKADAGGPSTLCEPLRSVVTLCIIMGSRSELSALTSTPTGIPSKIPRQRLKGLLVSGQREELKTQAHRTSPLRTRLRGTGMSLLV